MTDKSAAAIREFAEKQFPLSKELKKEVLYNQIQQAKQNECLSDLTALISEDYVEKAKYDEAVHQRDELRERCKQLEFMIEKGLGWDDMKNDITMPHEL